MSLPHTIHPHTIGPQKDPVELPGRTCSASPGFSAYPAPIRSQIVP